MPHLTNYTVIQNLSLSVRYKKQSKYLISTNTFFFKPTGVEVRLSIYYYSNIVPVYQLIPKRAAQTVGVWY